MELIERSEDLRAIEENLAEVPAGEGRCLLLSGPAGIGKTSLLDQACRRAGARGFELLRATGFEFERGHPFGVVRQLYAQTVRELDEPGRGELLGGACTIFEASGTTAASDPSHQVLLGLYWLLAELSQAAPLLIAVDDVQWADEPSIRHLLHLSRRLEDLPVAILLAERSGEASAPALEQLRAAAGLCVAPSPLGAEGARRLIEEAYGEPTTTAFAKACLRQTGGYPLYLKEAALALRERGVRPDDDAVGELEGIEAEGLGQHVWRRVDAVDPAAGKVVGAICVLGEGARRGRIARLAEVPAAQAVGIIDGLVARGVLSEGEVPRFSHPVVRAAVEARLAPGQRDRLHRSAARLLDSESAAIEETGNHLMRCVPEGDPWVAERLREFAAAALRRGAPESAAAAASRALEEPPPATDRVAVLRELAAAEDAAGRPDQALEHLAEAARRESTETRVQVEIAIARARILASVNRWPEAVSSLDLALDLASGTDDTTLEQMIDADLITYAIISESARARGFERLASYGGQVPDGPAAPAVLTAMAVAIGFTGERAPEAAALAERALQLDAQQGQGPDRERWLIAAIALNFCDRPDVAHSAALESLDQVRRDGHRREIFAVEIARAMASLQLGAIPEAVAAAQASISVVDQGPHGAWAHGIHALALFESGELGAVEEALAASSPEHWSEAAPGSFGLLWARAQLRIAQGRFEDAAPDLAELRRRGEAAGPGVRPHSEVRWPLEVLLAHRLGESERARELAAMELEFSRRFEGPHYIGQMLRLSGIVNEPDGLGFLREAVDVLAPSVFRLEYAKALVELGAALRRRGERAAAREPLREGLDLAYRCGAGPAVSQALEELRATGARPRRAVREGPDALTASESRTALLAARGRSNREIAQELCVTLKTVEGTLMRAYSKLGISGRGAREALPEALGPLYSE